jgi:predicted metal-dependent hydrolase
LAASETNFARQRTYGYASFQKLLPETVKITNRRQSQTAGGLIMAVKHVEVAGIGTISIYKRRGASSLRLSVVGNGKVRVTIPAWASFSAGLKYAQNQVEWIRQHQPAPTPSLASGYRVGKSHQLLFMRTPSVSKPTKRVSQATIIIKYPPTLSQDSPTVQALAAKASIEALRDQAETLLPDRLQALATKHGCSYYGVQVRKLKGRWGSCSSKKLIVLNLFLMQLPWELIDYVLLHELAHTSYMNHGPEFWSLLTSYEPKARFLRKQIKTHQPLLQPLSVQ